FQRGRGLFWLGDREHCRRQRRRPASLRSSSGRRVVRPRQQDDDGVHLEEVLTALTIVPTTTTTTAPIRLCQRNAMSRVHGENATVRTTAMPAMSPQTAPAAVARFTRIASANTPSSEP